MATLPNGKPIDMDMLETASERLVAEEGFEFLIGSNFSTSLIRYPQGINRSTRWLSSVCHQRTPTSQNWPIRQVAHCKSSIGQTPTIVCCFSFLCPSA
jgi:hypothetical protein